MSGTTRRNRRSLGANGNKVKKQHVITGKIARGQLVSTFGVGSLYEMRVYGGSGQWVTSVVIGGLDEWEKCLDDMEVIREPVLENVLRVSYFVEPPEESENSKRWGNKLCPSVPVMQFPRWLVCTKCDRLGNDDVEFRNKKGIHMCQAVNCSGHGVPVRLVSTCYHDDTSNGGEVSHPGHIDDFPWKWWAHSNLKSDWPCKGQKSQLKLISTGESAGWHGMRVVCQHQECKKMNIGRTLEGVFSKDALIGQHCSGNRPWLQDSETCTRPIRVLMRGASNVYFPVTPSAISIPPNSTACINEVGRIWRKSIEPSIKTIPELGNDVEKLISLVKNASSILKKFPDVQIKAAIEGQLKIGDSASNLPKSEAEQKSLERTAIVEERTDCSGAEGMCLFDAERVSDEDIRVKALDIQHFTENLVLVHRLREVKVLRGFHRLAEISGDSYSVPCAPLSRNVNNWLPAITVQGEGIYFDIKPELIRDWSEQDGVKERFNIIDRRYNAECKRRGNEENKILISPAFILVHTLSHLLINQLSLDCGYSSASLRERIYIQNIPGEQDWYGFMIYTASSSADGTLGGLVRQGEADLFSNTLKAAIENARWCSSDPLCIESEGQGVNALNLAACHACCITAETSCENRNVFLDRGLVVGTLEKPDIGFFYNFPFESK